MCILTKTYPSKVLVNTYTVTHVTTNKNENLKRYKVTSLNATGFKTSQVKQKFYCKHRM